MYPDVDTSIPFSLRSALMNMSFRDRLKTSEFLKGKRGGWAGYGCQRCHLPWDFIERHETSVAFPGSDGKSRRNFSPLCTPCWLEVCEMGNLTPFYQEVYNRDTIFTKVPWDVVEKAIFEEAFGNDG